MTSSRRWRLWTLPLLLYVLADFADPSIPGVFFFDSGVLFVDGVVQLKSSASVELPAMQPAPTGRLVEFADEAAPARGRVEVRPARQHRLRWKSPKHDDSASFAPSSGPDSLPAPPLS